MKTKLFLFTLLALLLLTPICIASDIETISSIDMTSEDIENDTYKLIESDVYLFDTDIGVDSIIDGNAFIFGNNITISGEIGGDVFVFGSNITISESAYIQGNIFAFGTNIIMDGLCYDMYVASENFTLGEEAIVSRDIRVISDNVNINGKIKRDAYITTQHLTFREGATNLILGNLEYTSPTEFNITDEIVGGNTIYTSSTSAEHSIKDKIAVYVSDIISTLSYSLVVILLTIWLAPKFRENVSNILKESAPKSFGIGILASVIIVIGSIALLFIAGGFGFGISIAAITTFILTLTISKTIVSMACAKLLANKFNKNTNFMFILLSLIVVLVISLLEIIPFVGGLIGFIVTMLGIGILLLNLITKKDTKSTEQVEVQE